MAALLAGHLPLARYAALLHDLHLLYSALETALDHNRGQAWLGGFDLAPLRRAPALQQDLQTLPAQPATSPARAYAQRLHALGRAHDPALLAHVYTRYLGDLHGGQILKRLAARQYGDIGLRFYDFGPEARVQQLRHALRQTLAHAPLQAGDAERIVEEARWSFHQHCALFDALAASP